MAHDVFISHASSDQSVANSICQLLEARGIKCWMAQRDVQPGVEFGEAIIQALSASNLLLLVFSSAADTSSQVQREIEYAARQGNVILPIRVEDVLPSKRFQYYIGATPWLDYFDPKKNSGFDGLANRVAETLARTGRGGASYQAVASASPAPPPLAPAASAPPRRNGRKTGWIAASIVALAITCLFLWLLTSPRSPNEGPPPGAPPMQGLGPQGQGPSVSAPENPPPVSTPAGANPSPAAPSQRLFDLTILILAAIVVLAVMGGLAWRLRPARSPASPKAREASNRDIAAEVAEQLRASRIEDLATLRLSAPLRQVLDANVAGLSETLDRIVRQAQQSQSVRDPGRRIEATEVALRLISNALSELVDESNPVVDAVTGAASEWATLFTGARDAARADLEDTRELENPFVFGNPVFAQGDGLFTGRRDLVLEIERNVLRAAQTPTLLLYGQRRMGKTSILNQLPALLGAGFLPVLVDCQAPAMADSVPALLRYLSRCLSAALNTRLGIVHADEVVRRARGIMPLSLEALREDPFSVFEDWLDELQARVPADTHLLLCLDEFERLGETVDAGWGARFLDGLRHWSQHRPRFALMFIGSHTFEQLGPVWTDRFLSARRLKVSFLAPDDVRQLLTRPTPTFRMTYASGALEAIIEVTNGQPFLTQVLASELVHHMNRDRRREATTSDVGAAIDDALERSAEYFVDLWSSRSEAERRVLRDAARGKTEPPTTAVARALQDYDVLDERGRFAVLLVRKWVERNELRAGQATV